MKRYTLLYYIAALFSLTTISCTDENSLNSEYSPSTGFIDVSDIGSIEFPPSSESQTVKINTNSKYKVETSETWVNAIPSNDYKTLTITCDDYFVNNNEVRSAMLTLTDQVSELKRTINIRQSPPSIRLSDENDAIVIFDPTASSKTLNISTNVNYDVQITETWLTTESSEDGKRLLIKVSKNNNDIRDAKVTLIHKESGISAEFIVIQSAPYLMVLNEPDAFDSSASSQEITISTNIDYEVKSSDPWLSAETSLDKKTLSICVTNYSGNDDRTATLTLYNDSFGLKTIIKVIQRPVLFTLSFTVTGYGKTVSFNMKLVEAGTFQMGKDAGGSDETPVHNVTLTKDYYIGETIVTEVLWYALMGTTARDVRDSHNVGYYAVTPSVGNWPMEFVIWDECNMFIDKLNTLLSSKLPSNMKFRLPTEAEWEFAAKGGRKSKGFIYSGSDNLDEVGWYSGNALGAGVREVKLKRPNELGLYDMSGNDFEWCYDWYESYTTSDKIDPTGPTTGSARVIRGGGCTVHADECRTVYRSYHYPSMSSPIISFRLVLQ